MKRLIKKVFILALFVFSAVAINGIQVNQARSQGNKYYSNVNKVVSYAYYKDVEVDNKGNLLIDGKYDPTLGEFQFSIHSKEVYKMAYDRNNDLVKYFRGDRIYIPTYLSKSDKRVKEISMTSSISEDFSRVRAFTYNQKGYISKVEEFDKSTNFKRMQMNFTKIQSVVYEYDGSNLVKETYNNHRNQNKSNSKYAAMSYSGRGLSKKEYYDENGDLEYYFTYNKNGAKQHKPDGGVVRDIKETKSGDFTTEYYPTVTLNYGNKWQVVASEKYKKGVEIGFYKQKGIIYRFSKIIPKKNGFAKKDYTVGKDKKGNKVIIENIFFTQYKSWKESSTLVQKAYAVLHHNDQPIAKKLYSKWLSKNGTDLLYALPFSVRDKIKLDRYDFIGAEYLIIASLKSSGSTTIAEIYNDDGNREWCDIVQGNLFFVASLSHGGSVNYNRLSIKSKGYSDFEFDFDVDKNKKIINLGELYMTRE